MKIIGKAEQKKIDLQIANLQHKVAELEKQLSASQASQQKIEATAKQAQVDAKAQLEAKANELAAANKALADAKAQAAAHGQSSSQAQESVQAQLDNKTKELSAAQAAAAKAKQDGDAALAAANKALADAKAQLDAKTKELAAAQAALVTANKALADAKAQLEAKTKELSYAQAAAAKAKQNSDAILSATKAQLETKSQDFEARNKELTTAKEFSVKFKQERDLANTAFAEAKVKIETQSKELTALKAERDKQAKLAQQTEAKYQDSAQENELLLLQLMQAQEELVEYYEQKGEFEKLYLAYKTRWERLEKRLPSYLDFGAIEIIDVDGVSDVPSITWQVKDFAQAGVALSEFSFVTVLHDGHPGIGLVKDGQPHAFVPKLLGTNKDQVATFLGLGTTEFKQLTAAVSILDQLEAGQWKGFEFPAQFDLSFWRPSIQTLLAQLKQLPALLRYDEVRLKRELINPDYEHLWLEFRGLSLGAAQWKKFEIRLGAALVQHDGFSHYPKFEIPLIDGKTKPFDSWYAESQDDSGAKLELRFALDKNVLDVAVWAKLADADKALLLRLIYAMPDALKRLEKQKAAIHRPWATWIDFATDAVKVLEVNKAAAKLPAPETAQIEATGKTKATKALPAPAEQAKLPAPAKLTSTGAKAGKVISITAKPVAKKAAKPAAKPAAAKTAAQPVAAKSAAKTPRKAKA
ncbi:hypothetical protein B9Z35_06185 [Limnohabitans sp. Jir61]|uniref:hypothetical protein n=1 Tax=Limnohabitans sp. Jir61 TaxID=1826168 RepID=UPI000D377181|nr:hypothetical protein [Limnohabitans sp. Jir61]PUE33107.1 hypothetical protein B9Z35_06185 [Limnohabitans sp. Jir61]